MFIDYCLNNRKFKCEECGEAFVEERTLNDHMERNYSDERNYVCDFKGCGKTFKTEVDLNNHKKSHGDEKPYPCSYCKKNLQKFWLASSSCLQKASRSIQSRKCSKS